MPRMGYITYNLLIHGLHLGLNHPLIRSPLILNSNPVHPRVFSFLPKPSNANGRRPIEAIKTIQLGQLRFVITTHQMKDLKVFKQNAGEGPQNSRGFGCHKRCLMYSIYNEHVAYVYMFILICCFVSVTSMFFEKCINNGRKYQTLEPLMVLSLSKRFGTIGDWLLRSKVSSLPHMHIEMY